MAVPADTFPQHPSPWTLDEVLAMPEDSGQRVELVDGAVFVSPAPSPRHQRLLHRMQLLLGEVLPPDLELLPGVNVVLNGGRLLIPDLVITTVPGHTGLYFTGDQVLLAAEVHSPSSRTYDRALKSQLYAEGGVQYLLLVEGTTEPPDAVLYGLADGGYRELGRSADGVLALQRPFDVTLDLNQRR